MDTTFFSLPKPFTTLTPIAPAAHHRLLRPLKFSPIRNTSSSNNNNTTSSDAENPLPAVQPPITPPDAVEIRFRRGSRRRSRQKDVTTDGMPKKAKAKALAPKDWEAMTITEKAVELYMGEKGLLFWLNKFAYASIFIIIGGWILFRFVGPALNLYQLDSVPLSPSSMFKGS